MDPAVNHPAAAAMFDLILDQERVNDMEQKRVALQDKLEAWEKKLDRYKLELMSVSSLDEQEVLTEKSKNLSGMLMGCQQEILMLQGILEKEELALETKKYALNSLKGQPAKPESFLFQDDTFPGMTFFEPARTVSITVEAAKLDFEADLGMSLSIPENSVEEGEIVELSIQPAFSGPCAGYKDTDPVSPLYIIRAAVSGEDFKFKQDITIKLQHHASLRTEQDCKDLIVMFASHTPLNSGPLFGPIYTFHEVKGGKFSFSLSEQQFGEVNTCCPAIFQVWRRRWRKVTIKEEVIGHKDEMIEDAVAKCVEEGQVEQCISEGNEGKKGDLGASKDDNFSDRLSTADKGDERTEERKISDEGESGRVEDEDNENSAISGDENAEEGSEYPASELKAMTSSTDGDQEGTIAEAQSGQQSCEVNDDKETVKMETESSSKLPPEKMEHCEVGKLYYAQLFKGINSRAIFCMCQHFPQYIKYCEKAMIKAYSEYEITNNSDFTTEKGGLILAKDKVVLYGVAQCSVVTKADIDLPLLMRVDDVSNFSKYPPSVVIYLADPDEDDRDWWTLSLEGLVEDVTFTISAKTVVVEENRESAKAAQEFKPSLKNLLQLKWEDEEGEEHTFRLVNKVSDKWREFGAVLKIAGSILDKWEEEYGKVHKRWQKVMKHWLRGKGGNKYPPKWEGLYTMLQALEYHEVASQLQVAVKSIQARQLLPSP